MKKGFVTILVLLVTASAFAQTGEVKAYSLKEAVDFAVANNVAAKKAKLDEQKAKAFNWEIMTQGLPQVSGSVDYNYYFKTPQVPAIGNLFSDTSNTFAKAIGALRQSQDPAVQNALDLLTKNSGGQGISFVLPNSLSAGFQITQLFFDARYMFGIQARKDLYKTSRLTTSLTEQEIRYNVTKAYYQAEAAQEAKGMLGENLKLIDKGLIEELDVNRLELAKATLESQINLQNQMAEVGLFNLKYQMGLALSTDIVLKDKLDDLKVGANVSGELKFDAKNRIEYDLLTTAVTLKGYDVAQKRSGYYPSLVGFLNYNWTVQTQKGSDMFTRQNTYDPNTGQVNGTATRWYPTGLIGLSLKIPIFDSGLKMMQVKQAKLEQMKMQADFENFKNASELQFISAKANLNTAIGDEANAQRILDLSKKIFTTNQAKFTSGLSSSFELAQSQQEYATNQVKMVQSKMNVLIAKSELDKALGVK